MPAERWGVFGIQSLVQLVTAQTTLNITKFVWKLASSWTCYRSIFRTTRQRQNSPTQSPFPERCTPCTQWWVGGQPPRREAPNCFQCRAQSEQRSPLHPGKRKEKKRQACRLLHRNYVMQNISPHCSAAESLVESTRCLNYLLNGFPLSEQNTKLNSCPSDG